MIFIKTFQPECFDYLATKPVARFFKRFLAQQIFK